LFARPKQPIGISIWYLGLRQHHLRVDLRHGVSEFTELQDGLEMYDLDFAR